MKSIECEFEAEALAAALQSRWPERASADLRAHVAACAICSDIVAIADTIDNAYRETRAAAVLPDSGQVWWRAQLRAKREAAEAAGRPITATQIFALACATGVLGAFFGATSTRFQSLVQSLVQSTTGGVLSTLSQFSFRAALAATPAFISAHQALLLMLGAMFLLVPAVVCLAVLRD